MGYIKTTSNNEKPWYSQFWPWFLIVLPASAVAAGLVTLWIAHDRADNLVRSDYYKEGLAINRRLTQEQMAEQLGITGSLKIENGAEIILNLSGEVQAGALNLEFNHPANADRDFQLRLTQTNKGTYRAYMPASAARQRWYLILTPIASNIADKETDQSAQWRILGEYDPNHQAGTRLSAK